MKISDCIKLVTDDDSWERWMRGFCIDIQDEMPPENYPCYAIQQADGFNYYYEEDLELMVHHLSRFDREI